MDALGRSRCLGCDRTRKIECDGRCAECAGLTPGLEYGVKRRLPYGAPLKMRFWNRVAVPDERGCMVWLGATDEHGYGQLNIGGGRTRIRASRCAYELANGPIPDDLHVLHRCDNPPCVNPAHLFLGTPRDNAVDRSAKGRHEGQLRTICRNGLHERTPENTRVVVRGGRTMRICVPCDNASRERHRSWRAKAAAKVAS